MNPNLLQKTNTMEVLEPPNGGQKIVLELSILEMVNINILLKVEISKDINKIWQYELVSVSKSLLMYKNIS